MRIASVDIGKFEEMKAKLDGTICSCGRPIKLEYEKRGNGIAIYPHGKRHYRIGRWKERVKGIVMLVGFALFVILIGWWLYPVLWMVDKFEEKRAKRGWTDIPTEG